MSAFNLKIITPEAVVFTAEIEALTAPGKQGAFEVLKGHALMVSQLVSGPLKIKMADGTEKMFAVHPGYLEVSGKEITMLVDAAEPAEKINPDRAKASAKRARERLAQKQNKDIDLVRAQGALARALTRLQVRGVKETE